MSYQDDLTAAQFAVENKIGQVMSSGSAILATKAKAQAYLSSTNPAVVSQAQAVVSKADGLVANLNSIQADSIGTMKQASDMNTKMNTDPTWQAILTGNTSSLGWASLAVVQTFIGQATNLTQQIYTLSNRADDHLSAVSDLQSNEADLENFAAGKGVKAMVSGFGSSITGAVSGAAGIATSYMTMIEYGAVAVALFFIWDLAKPFVSAARVHKNPRRRRRVRHG